MKITKGVITAAGPMQQALPLQTLIDRDGTEKSVLGIIVEEMFRAGIEEVCVVVRPGNEGAYAAAMGDHVGRVEFVPQAEPLGYGHAVYCARSFIGADSFLHLVGDHLYVARSAKGCAQQLVEVAEKEECAVSAVQATRESMLPYYGAIGGRPIAGQSSLYEIERVLEKPTPTIAEQQLIVPGLRTGHYLCFFGMHVLTPTLIDILGRQLENMTPESRVSLSDALAELAGQEKYLALQKYDFRYDVGVKYGLLTAQLALALSGDDRNEVLTKLLELLAERELGSAQE